MPAKTKTIYELMEEVENHPDYLFGTVFTLDDLDGKQAKKSFRREEAEEALMEAGHAYLDNHTRPSCDYNPEEA